MDRKAAASGGLSIGGYFFVEGTDWNGKRFRQRIKNGVNFNALNTLLSTYFKSLTPITQWFMGLIDNTNFVSISQNDLAANHPGWVENIQYSQSGRPAWVSGVATGQVVTNSTNVLFTMTANCIIQGIFLTSDAGIGATTGLLWSTGLFPAGPQTLLNGSPLNVGYTLAAAGN